MPDSDVTYLLNSTCKHLTDDAHLSQTDIERYQKQLDNDWTVTDDMKSIYHRFDFNNYIETMDFVNSAAAVAQEQDHHPEMTITYNTCKITYSTHSIDGLSINDFICAAKTDQMLNI